MTLELVPIPGVPEIRPGDDLASALSAAMARNNVDLDDQDILTVTQKVVSKAENRIRQLDEVQPSAEAIDLSGAVMKDARLVEVILRESRRVLRQRPDLLITETHHGFVCANAGVDRSNIDGTDTVTMLPRDPDRSARQLRERLGCGIIITDTFGRPWREGLVDVCIGIAGPPALLDLRGDADRFGYRLSSTVLCAADALAAAAGLLMGKAQGIPAVRIRGYEWAEGSSGAAALVRAREQDLFR